VNALRRDHWYVTRSELNTERIAFFVVGVMIGALSVWFITC
jgi:hypothetical protein